jgi:hypothetical protein
LRSGSVISTSSSSIECKGIVYAIAEGLLKLNSNTAGLPSVAAAAIVAGWSRIIIVVPVAEAVPEQ